MTSRMLDAARSYSAAGLCVLPAKWKEKYPALSAWKSHQYQLPSESQVVDWFNSATAEAMCIITGAVSGNLELLDFDCQAEVYSRWCEMVEDEAPGLIARLLVERSQSDGRHVVYRLAGEVPGSAKLAEKVCIAPNGEPVIYKGKQYVPRKVGDRWEYYPTLVETKGEGGLFLCAPSFNYTLIAGTFEELPVISDAEREILIRCARSFNEKIEMARQPTRASAADGRPGDEFNDRGDVRDILTDHGWKLVRPGENEHWCRPGKDAGCSATFNGQVFYVFTSNAPPFDLDSGYSKFQVYALLEHAGDYSKAASALRTQGYGSQPASLSRPADAQVVHPDPLPLDDPKPPTMPPGLLPGWLGQMAECVAEATETPLELSGLLGLSAVATATQGKFSVRPEPGYFEPVNIWTAPAMKSGQRKTAVHKRMSGPLLDWESEQCAEAAKQITKVESEIKTIEARVAKLRVKCAGENDPTKRDQLKDEITQLEATIPPLPVLPRLFTQDVTPEHLGTMMAQQGERMAVLSDEGGIFDILAGRYSGGIPNLDLFLQAHSGAPVRVDRGSRPSVILNHPLLTMGLSPQPDVLRALNNKPGFRGRGLLARFLYALPESKMGHRDLEPREVPTHVAGRYAEGVRALLETTLRNRDGQKPVPHVLSFDTEGYAAWKEYQRRVEVDLRETGRFAGITDWAGKLPGAVARLAGLMHSAKYALEPAGPADRRIDCEVVQCAVRLGELLAEHALIVFGLISDNSALEGARKVWRYVQDHQMTTFTFSDIWHPLRGTFKTTEDIEPAIEMLLDHYLLLPDEENSPGRVGRRGRRFMVNPKAKREVSDE